MSTQKSMLEVSVKELINNYNLIVPEIQREYVWGFNGYGILDTFLSDINEGFKNSKKDDNKPNIEIDTIKGLLANATDATTIKSLNTILEGLTTKPTPLNIGFLYSYRPDYYVFNDRNEDLYLIDGQQRFTTLFLILYYLSIKENKQEDFIELFRFDEKIEHIAFDYRVRTLTHNFFIDLISNSKSIDDLLNIRSKNWFLSNYNNDVTVQSIVGKESIENSGVFQKLNHYFKNEHDLYYDFVKTQIKFWHFKTEETSQGEELYITMNSRGQQLADNETVRARLFDTEAVKSNPLEWSEKWEIWQDFFWKNRDKSNIEISADEGFNEFLRWVQIIKMTELQEINVEDENEEALDKKDIISVIKWGKGNKLNVDYLNLTEIESFFKALKYLYETFPKELENIKSNYLSYQNFNLLEKKWLCPADNNNSILQIDSFSFLPILYYCKERIEKEGTIDPLKLFRLIRFFHNLRKDPNVFKSASIQTINALKLIKKLNADNDITDVLDFKGISSTILNNEERKKLQLIKVSNNRFRLEDLFWRAEDIKQNNGEILQLIELNNVNSNDQTLFNIDIFEKQLIVFEEFIEKEHFIWGNLINTDVYNETWDRITYDKQWHKSEGFLQLVLTKQMIDNIGLKDFLIIMQKSFIKNYDVIEDIENEKSFKKQIYIYYILQFNSLMKNASKWEWHNGWNFGTFQNYPNHKSLFKDSFIYQLFDVQFRENESKILWGHKNISNKKVLLENLLKWSKE
ncbi:GmrSD restriction endonuclease domain-containing protein [Flavobacterium sp. XS1P32]|uniref:GmrSD restriction endonuclease domain-containing protein n=1 Tax=Flavobacterium sp. XS1P32 TaxID=3401726 RepID=UPI003AB07EFF